MSAATMYMTLLSQRSGVSITVVSDPTVNVAPIIGATPDVTPAVWSSGVSDTQRWEMADTSAGPWSTVSDMPAITTPYTDQTFGKVLRWYEAQGGEEAVSEAVGPVAHSFVLRDTFDGSEASPIATPRASGWVVTQSSGTIAVVNGQLEMTGASVLDVTKLVSAAMTRAAGLAFFVKRIATAGTVEYGFSFNGNWDSGHIYRPNSGVVQRDGTDTTNALPTAADAFGVILRASGAFFVILKDGVWQLHYMHALNTTASVRAMLNHFNATKNTIDKTIVTQLTAPFTTDTGIATTVMAGARAAGNTFTHEHDFLLDFIVTTLPASGDIEIRFHRQDASNYYRVSNSSTGALTLSSVAAGTPTTIQSVAATVTNGERVVIKSFGSTIRVYEGDKYRVGTSSATLYLTETDGELNSLGTGGAVSDLVIYPFTLSGAAAAELDRAYPIEITTLPLMENIGKSDVSNPVIALGVSGSDSVGIREIGNVLYEPSDTGREYKVTYTGYGATYGTDEKIHYAYSADGKSWTKYASNPVISARRAEDPYVVKVGGVYYLFAEDKQAGVSAIRRWHSADFQTWVDDGQITGLGDCASPVVWMDGATWMMLFEDMDVLPTPTVSLATSSDGLAWTLDTADVLTNDDIAWSASGDVVPDDIVEIEGTYYMTYHIFSGVSRSGVAISTDLITWSDAKTAELLTLDKVLEAGRISTASVFPNASNRFLFYNADDDGVYFGYATRI